MWLFLALLGYSLLSLVLVLDKFILTKSVPKPVVYTFYSTIFTLALLPVCLFFPLPTPTDYLVMLMAGLAFGFALYALYTGVQQGEASHLYPFNGAVLTVTTFSIARFVFGEKLSEPQMMGVILLILASLLLTGQKVKHGKLKLISFWWVAISGVLFAVSLTLMKYVYAHYAFFPALIWWQALVGVTAIILFLFSPDLRLFLRQKSSRSGKKSARQWPVIVTNKALSVAANVLIQAAIALGSVTLVNALAGLQYVLVFIFMLLLTRFWPRILKESFTPREVLVQSIAICLVAGGAALVAL